MTPLWIVVPLLALSQAVAQHPLDDYVNLPDNTYSYDFLGSYRDDPRGLTIYDLNMTSQTWVTQTEDFSSQPIWYHYMALIVPDVVDYTQHGVLFISEGNMDDGPPNEDNDNYIHLAKDMASRGGMVVGLLNQIPNQPIVYREDPKQMARREDDSIAFTMRKFILDNGEDPNVLLLFPMTKAAIRAMDTIQDASSMLGFNIEKFFITGGSKRAWTTYLAAATDPLQRAYAIMPMVFTLLNTQANLMRHYQALGDWSWAMEPYYNEGLSEFLTDPLMTLTWDMFDPYVFRDRVTIPKLLVSSTGDEFFFPHETHLFFDDLQGPKYYLMTENAQHFLLGHHQRIIDDAVSFTHAIIDGVELPTLSWERTVNGHGTGTLRLVSQQQPVQVVRWTATTTDMTADRRDFRMLYLTRVGPTPNPIVWSSEEVLQSSDGSYQVTFETPASGWRGFFLTVTYELANGSQFETTSEVHFLPEQFPFPQCEGDGCIGELV